MPIIDLTVSRTASGNNMTDLLSGGSTGMDMGTCVNGAASIAQNMYIRHTGTSKITSLAYYILPYTGSYGGNFSPANDYARLRVLGDLGGGDFGLQVCEEWNQTVPFTTFFKVATGAADSYSTRRSVSDDSMFHVHTETSAQTDATAPQVGIMGVNDNSTESLAIGNRALLRARLALPSNEPDGGVRQWDWVLSYVFTQ